MQQGDKVIAKHKNGRYYQCKIVDTDQQIFCEVDFDDGSFSNDLLPEDIKVSLHSVWYTAAAFYRDEGKKEETLYVSCLWLCLTMVLFISPEFQHREGRTTSSRIAS